MKSVSLAIFFFLILLPLSTAQVCNTGADINCYSTVDMYELTDYINLWYGCSACYPDLFQAIEAYYSPPQPAGNVYYLDAVNGDDSNNGGIDSPWQSIDKAFRTATYGDTVILRNGNYGDFIKDGPSDFPIYEGSMTEPLPSDTEFITFKADQGHSPVFRDIQFGGGADGKFYMPYIFEGLTARYFLVLHGVGMRLINLTVAGSTGTTAGIFINRYGSNTNNDIIIENCTVHTHPQGIKAFGNNIVIRGNNISGVDVDLVTLANCENVLIENNFIHGAAPAGYDPHPDAIVMCQCRDVTIRKNVIGDIPSPGEGLYFYTNCNNHDILIEKNVLYDISSYEIILGSDNGQSSNIVIRNNTVIGHFSSGVHGVKLGVGNDPDNQGLQNVSVYNNLFLVDYQALGTVTWDYHDYNIFAEAWFSSPGDDEPNSYGYASFDAAWADRYNLFMDPDNDDYRPKMSSIVCDGSHPGTQQGVAWAGALECVGVANVYYVSQQESCDDTWEGSSTHPWCTIGKAFQTATYGDIVLIRNGSYGEINNPVSPPVYSGSMSEPLPSDAQFITFRADTGHQPVFDRLEFGSWYNVSYYTPYIIDGIRIDGDVWLKHVVGIRLWNLEIVGPGPGVRGVYEISVQLQGATFPYTNNDIEIENCSIHHWWDGINTFGSNIVIRGNDVYGIGKDHMVIHAGKNILIENNQLHDGVIVYPDDPDPEHSDMIAMCGLTDVTIRNNTIYNNQNSQGIFFHGGCWESNVTIENNLIYNISAIEIQLGDGGDITVKHNTVIGHPDQLGIVRFGIYDGLQDIDVYNNLFVTYYER
ncbi:MAG: right-handed parallel beta-helix repeat-containing protein, partial [Candidatus Aenigmatarchaeota archaeon]